MNSEQPKVRRHYVYLGQILDGDKAVALLMKVTSEQYKSGGPLGLEYEANFLERYPAKAGKHFKVVGGVYTVECVGETLIVPSSAKYIDFYGLNEANAQVAAWQALADARAMDIRVSRNHSTDAKFDALKNRLDPVRLAYRRCRANERAILLARVVQYLMS